VEVGGDAYEGGGQGENFRLRLAAGTAGGWGGGDGFMSACEGGRKRQGHGPGGTLVEEVLRRCVELRGVLATPTKLP